MTIWTKGMGAIIKAIPRKLKVSPDIKSVSPTKLSVKESLKKTKSKEYLKRIDKLDAAQKKVKEGKKMMREGQKERKRMVDTGTAFQFRDKKTWHPLKPGDKKKYKINKKGISRVGDE
mgnify:CR=1 FL=1